MKIYSEETIKKISRDISIVDYVANYVELKRENRRLYGLCPFHNEKTGSFMVDEKQNRYYCFGCKAHGGIIKFVMSIDGLSFSDAVEKLANYSGVSLVQKQMSDTLRIFKKLKSKSDDKIDHKILPYSIYSKYSQRHIPLWENEGIPFEIIKRYDIRFDNHSQRIVYPVYDDEGNLINIKGRTIIEDYKTLKLPKYINYFKVGGMDYLQGLWCKKDIVKEKNEVIIFEGIKSCMKAESWGFDNVVSAETAGLNQFQIKEIIKLHCDVVVAFDKDKTKEDVVKSIGWLPRFTNVYIVIDTQGLLGDESEKNSPVDKGELIWRKLYRTRERV